MAKTILSIDCGTQSLRAFLFSLKGDVIGISKIPFEPYQSPHPGWAEQNPEIYKNALIKSCKQLSKNFPNHFENIAGVGVTSIRNTMICVDEEGEALRPAIVWLDQRKAKPVYKPWLGMRLLIRLIGMRDSINKAQRDGKCNWIKQNDPEVWRKTHKYLQVSAYLTHFLCGKFKDSVASQIGHIPFDYKKQKWGNPKSLLVFSAKIFPVKKEKLPELVHPGKILGTVTDNAAKLTGLNPGLSVVAAGSDKGCGTIGVGAQSEQTAHLSFGTTAVIQTINNKYKEPIRFMPSYPAVIPGKFNPEVEVFRGFWMITWFKNQFAHQESEEAKKLGIGVEEHLNLLLKKSEPGSKGLITQPFWTPGLKQPSAKGAIIGYGDVHDKAAIYRSIIEGICFALYQGKEKIEKVTGQVIKQVKVSGGASQSDEICQIAADVFNLPIVRGITTESSGLGAAMLAAYGIGAFESLDDAIESMCQDGKTFSPNPENHKIYSQLYGKVYKIMYSRLSPLYKEIRKITGYPE